MTREQLLEEYSSLPDDARNQIAEFIHQLHERYTSSALTESRAAKNLDQEPFVGMWKDREELDDSIRWVKNARKTEWNEST